MDLSIRGGLLVVEYVAPVPMQNRLAGTLAFVFLLLAGCSTTPPAPGRAAAVPKDRITAPDMLQPAPGRNIPVTITRDGGFMGGAMGCQVQIDGREIARYSVAETLTIYLSPGEHKVRLWSEFFGEDKSTQTINAGTPQNFRIWVAGQEGFRIVRS